MTLEILKSIKKFEQLQSKYADYGAQASETHHVFQTMISHALSDRKLEIGQPIDWGLTHPAEDLKLIIEELTTQAWNVYTTILSLSQKADLEELRRYCWRVYKS